MSKPYRIDDGPGSRYGRLIDRTRPVTFRFNGKRYKGFAGDTLASALLANGVTLFARSRRYHRPRGLLSAGADEPNALVSVGTGPARRPNIPATIVPIRDGLSAWSQSGFPGRRLDMGALAGPAIAAFPADLAFKTFMAPGGNAWSFYSRALRRLNDAGDPPPPSAGPAEDVQSQETVCQVLVVGGGVAGIAAAQAAAGADANVILCEATRRFGGLSDLYAKPIDGKAQTDWVASRIAALRLDARVRLLSSTTLIDIADDGTALLFESPAEGGAAAQGTLWRIRANRILLATGAREQPLIFADNDRPGIMLASAVRIYLRRYGIVPGARGVVFTNNDDAYQTALALHDTGAVDMRVVDMRPEPGGEPVMRAMAAGIRMSFASAIAGVETRAGGTRLNAVSVAAMGHVDLSRTFDRIACDFVCMSGGWAGNNLFAASGERFSDKVRTIGAAHETLDIQALVREAMNAGDRAARETVGAAHQHFDSSVEKQPPAAAVPVAVPAARDRKRNRWRFVDFRQDVLERDIIRATDAGNRSLAQIRRYTGLGSGVDRGATSLANAARIVAEAAGGGQAGAAAADRPIIAVSFAALAAAAHKADSLSPTHAVIAPEADMTADWLHRGGWRLPAAYRRKGETRAGAVARETDAVHTQAGIIDLSARCLIEISGNDAATFLSRACTISIRSLNAGTFSDGYLLDDYGRIVDFARVARTGAARFRLTGSVGRGGAVLAWLNGLQSRWRKLSVQIADVTGDRAQIAIAGPGSAEILKSLRIAAAMREETTGREIKTGIVQGRPYELTLSRAAGVECSEFLVAAQDAGSLWSALRERQAVPVGFDALNLLRLERGMPPAEEILDAGLTPAGLGSSFPQPSKKSDFVGKGALDARNGRRIELELVGLLAENDSKSLETGAHGTTPRQPAHLLSAGYVVSSGRSRVLGRPVALGVVVQGQRRLGEQMLFSSGKEPVTAKIVDPIFSR